MNNFDFLFQFFKICWLIFKQWWWVLFPLPFYFSARYFYFWWLRWENWYKRLEWIVLEIIPPRESKKPFSAMEQVFATLARVLVDSPNWKQRWCQGGPIQGFGGWASIEVCSFGGEIHFYLRCQKKHKEAIEAAIYSQYPEAEIFESEDYTQKIPKNIPNQTWDLLAFDYTLQKEDYLPIKIYSKFFELPIEEKRIVEEKRIDPMNNLLEAFSKIKGGTQIWLQICFTPLVEDVWGFLQKAKAEIAKLSKRKVPSKKGVTDEIDLTLKEVTGKLFFPRAAPAGPSPPSPSIGISLTPSEQEILELIEKKLSKPNFQCWIRGIALWRNDREFTPGAIGLINEYLMGQFYFYNSIVFYGATRTKIHYWLRERRTYLRKRQRLREYIQRVPTLWPRSFYGTSPPGPIRKTPGSKAICILSSEELATIFHFPAKITLPSVPRIETKKVGPPPILPTI